MRPLSLGILAALAVIVLGGAAIAIQAPVNARLSRHVGDPVTAAAISFAVGFVALSLISASRGGLQGLVTARGVPWWAYCGGLLGAIYVWAAAWSVSHLGVVTLVAALILGQLLAALALDATGAFGLPVKDISLTRIAAVLLVTAGIVLSRY